VGAGLAREGCARGLADVAHGIADRWGGGRCGIGRGWRKSGERRGWGWVERMLGLETDLAIKDWTHAGKKMWRHKPSIKLLGIH